MQDLSIDDFAGWIGGECQVALGDACLPMTLLTAEPLAGSPRSGGGFRLEFLGPADPILPQSIMTVSGPPGTHDIFLVPIAGDAGGARYEAVYY